MGLKCLFGHKWSGCKCKRCGKIRDKQHNWNGCKCSRCGKVRDEQHNWNGCKCIICGKFRRFTQIEQIEQINDITALEKIIQRKAYSSEEIRSAVQFKIYDLRRDRILNMTNHAYLMAAIKSEDDWYVRSLVMKKLNNQIDLAYFANNDENCKVRVEAIAKLTDQAVLANIVKDTPSFFIKKAAIARISDQVLLNNIVENEESYDVCIPAIEKITDQTVLIDIAKSDKDLWIREAALEKLTDQTVKIEIIDTIKENTCALGNHRWVPLGGCRKICVRCNIIAYDHDYVTIKDNGIDSYVREASYECKKCGHTAEYRDGISNQDSYDHRLYGIVE